MSGIFDRLQERMELEAKEGGISPIELMDLPPLMRKIMRLMLREFELTYQEIITWSEDLDESERPTRTDLDASLNELSKQLWLIKRGEGERERYQANLRHKSGSKIAQGVWNVLDKKIVVPPANESDKPQE
jgi:hypothetical protein